MSINECSTQILRVKSGISDWCFEASILRWQPDSQLLQRRNYKVLLPHSICLWSPLSLPWYFSQFLFTCSKEVGIQIVCVCVRVCVGEGKWNPVLSHGPQQAMACLISQLSCVSVSLSRMCSSGPSEQSDLFCNVYLPRQQRRQW